MQKRPPRENGKKQSAAQIYTDVLFTQPALEMFQRNFSPATVCPKTYRVHTGPIRDLKYARKNTYQDKYTPYGCQASGTLIAAHTYENFEQDRELEAQTYLAIRSLVLPGCLLFMPAFTPVLLNFSHETYQKSSPRSQ